MPFSQYMKLVPAECNEKTKNYIKRKLNELDVSIRDLKIKCGMCKVTLALFKENRKILVTKLRKRFPNSMVLLKGNYLKESPPATSNCPFCFQQEPFFYWTFGVEKPNLWGAIDVETETSYIFYDKHLDKNIVCPKHLVKKYMIDKVIPYTDMKHEICKLGRNMFLVLSNMDEKTFNGLIHQRVVSILANCGVWICNTVLTPVLKEVRMVKSLNEQVIMRCAAKLNSEGIVYVLRNLKPGMKGYCTGALFDLYTMSSSRHVSRPRPISCLAGANIFCLDPLKSNIFLKESLGPGNLCILDMGLALRNYNTNLIATIPVNGVFSDPQALIYTIVLEVRSFMLKMLKPGIKFAKVSHAARKKLVNLMIQNFILEGTVHEIMESGLCDIFNPHGIGHFLGIEFYDCQEESDSKNQSKRYLEHFVAKEGMILALNSELYLNEVIIKKWMDTPAGEHLQSRHIQDYFHLAARIQDVVLITSHSSKLLANLPRTIEDIQNTMSDKVEISFITPKVLRPPVECKWDLDFKKFEIFKRMPMTDPYICRNSSMLNLRYEYELETEKRLDMQKALEMLKESREWKPMKCLNQVMQEVYQYPFRIHNMLELVLIPLTPHRRMPNIIPFPEVSPLTKARIQYPPQGYGCPFFNWYEGFESCMAIKESCLE